MNDLSNANYGVGNEIYNTVKSIMKTIMKSIICNTEVLKSNLCNYNDAYIIVKGKITVKVAPKKQVAFKNCAPFTKYITKIDGTTIDDVEDLDLVMAMHNLIEYSSNYSETTGSLWSYYKDEATNFNANIGNTDDLKSFKYKAKLLETTVAEGVLNNDNSVLKNATIAVPLKYLTNFWRSLEIVIVIVFCQQQVMVMIKIIIMMVII